MRHHIQMMAMTLANEQDQEKKMVNIKIRGYSGMMMEVKNVKQLLIKVTGMGYGCFGIRIIKKNI